MTTRMGPYEAGQAHPTNIPPSLEEVALVDATQIAAAARRSLSWWYEEVSQGRAPKPVIRGPRCTRWRLADIRQWLIEQAESGGDPGKADRLLSTTRKASAQAQAKRTSSNAKG